MATVLITGGTGMIGRQLAALLLEKGYEVILLSRQQAAGGTQLAGLSYAQWNMAAQTIDARAIARADYIVHLAGAGVADKRWTAARKQEIVDSRTQSSTLLVKALKDIPNQVKAIVSASAIGWYGADTAHSLKNGFSEEALADTAFLGNTCRLWEESIQGVEATGKRLVRCRIGIVLSKQGGALAAFKKPIRAGLAAIPGNGRQVISWIHVKDLCRLFLYAIENNKMKGVYNAVSPQPVTNEQLTLALAQKLRGRFFISIHIPAWLLKIILGGMSIEILKSATVSSKKTEAAGFRFEFPTLEAALADQRSLLLCTR